MKKKLMGLVLGAMFFAFIGVPAFAQEYNMKIDDSELKKSKSQKPETVEAYLGYVAYDYDTAQGTNFWAKGRVFLLNTPKIGVGIMGYYAAGSGDTPTDFGYDNSEYAGGGTVKSRHEDWDSTIDLGVGKHSDSGSVQVNNPTGFIDPDGKSWPVKGMSSSDSDSTIAYAAVNISVFPNRAHGDILFPKWEVNGTYIAYLSTTTKESWQDAIDPKNSSEKSEDKSGKSNWEVEGRVWLVDLWASKNLRITPGVLLGAGSTVNDESYTKYGAAVELATKRVTILQVSFEEHAGDQNGSAICAWTSFKF